MNCWIVEWKLMEAQAQLSLQAGLNYIHFLLLARYLYITFKVTFDH